MSFRDQYNSVLAVEMSTFGEPVEYHHTESGEDETIQMVFDEKYQAIDIETNAIVSSNQPRFGVKLDAFLTEPTKGDVITVEDERQFTVTDVQEDGQGGASLYAKLKKADRV